MHKFLIVYSCKIGMFRRGMGNCDFYSDCEELSMDDVREAEKQLTERHGTKNPVIINWKRIQKI